jgi:hypothetical protein
MQLPNASTSVIGRTVAAGKVMLPLRVALTGGPNAPAMADMCARIGQAQVIDPRSARCWGSPFSNRALPALPILPTPVRLPLAPLRRQGHRTPRMAREPAHA